MTRVDGSVGHLLPEEQHIIRADFLVEPSVATHIFKIFSYRDCLRISRIAYTNRYMQRIKLKLM